MVFSTDLLDELQRQRRLELEQLRHDLLAKTIQWLEKNGDHHGIKQAYILGSVIQSQRFNRESDVNLAVEQINLDSGGAKCLNRRNIYYVKITK